VTPGAGITATARFLAGGGVGALYAVAIAHIATSRSPDRAFGIVVTANHIVGAALLTMIAWLSNLYPGRAAFLIVVTFQLLTAFFIVQLPGRPSSASHGRQARAPIARRTGLPALLGLFGMFLLATAFGSVWPIMGQIAAKGGIASGEVTLAFSLAGAAGLIPGLLVTAIGLRAGRAVPLVLGSLAFGGSLMLPGSGAPFAVATVLVMFFWTFNIPYHLGLVAAIDRSGRLTVFTSAMLPLGIAVGQAGAGQMAAVQGVNSVTVVGGILAAAAGVTALLTLHVARDLMKSLPQEDVAT
jgi:predicted MFS family arabinose efflux permease